MTKRTPKKNGRRSLRSKELETEILARLSNGEPLAHICREEGKPHISTWATWCRQDEALGIAHARARDDGFDVIAASVLDIIDEKPERVISMQGDDKTESRIDSASVQWAKNRAEYRLKLLAKWDPKRYGDKVDHTLGNPDGTPITFTTVFETKPSD